MSTDDSRTPGPASDPYAGAPGSGEPLSGDPASPAGGTDSRPQHAPSGAAKKSKKSRSGVSAAKNTRTARAWSAWIIGAIILIFLLVFIIQNSASTDFQIFAWHFNLPLGVAILFAAIVGALITAFIGGARMLQLRKAARKVR